ncbi:MAG TPA: hypothetical protein DIU15_13930, partial [Deltaproteobacteria bacterium]|nr:hypothetical protein [Deltaproteobacteria bacterium]
PRIMADVSRTGLVGRLALSILAATLTSCSEPEGTSPLGQWAATTFGGWSTLLMWEADTFDFTTTSSWADIDGDGDLDLLL